MFKRYCLKREAIIMKIIVDVRSSFTRIPLLFDYDFYYHLYKIDAAFSFDNDLVLVCLDPFVQILDRYSIYVLFILAYFNYIQKYILTNILVYKCFVSKHLSYSDIFSVFSRFARKTGKKQERERI